MEIAPSSCEDNGIDFYSNSTASDLEYAKVFVFLNDHSDNLRMLNGIVDSAALHILDDFAASLCGY